ncbi:ferritin [bacterium CG17_big_fil_post_rev_8_21_14_2_50_64_8]|nr:MAG: ferritin [bacterium CG17_big_fil_post_rev_8_21_14_2_50_64_8]PJA73150.1 MAG: ferritin [bacterium CG_4_9_14_3_um_filter_65_15]
MLSQKLQDALNKQINEEYYSSYLYTAMVAYMESLNLDGCAHWMKMQAEEEHQHAHKIFTYMVDRGGRVELQAVKAPPQEWDSPVEAFKAALEHEEFMTRNINALADLAQSEHDHATNNLMQWYVTEQVEEEANVDDILKKLEMVGGSGQGLFMIDRELMTRPAPAPLTEGGAA